MPGVSHDGVNMELDYDAEFFTWLAKTYDETIYDARSDTCAHSLAFRESVRFTKDKFHHVFSQNFLPIPVEH